MVDFERRGKHANVFVRPQDFEAMVRAYKRNDWREVYRSPSRGVLLLRGSETRRIGTCDFVWDPKEPDRVLADLLRGEVLS